MKKKLSLILVVIILLQIILPIISVVWESELTNVSKAITSGDWEYLINSDKTTIEITKYKGDEKNFEIPNKIDGYRVTRIGDDAFKYCTTLESVTIPNGVISIGYCAFFYCASLKSISIPTSVTSIENSAFTSCISLNSINIPNSVTSIGDGVFSSCNSLTSINVDNANKYYSSENGVLFNKNKTELIRYPAGKEDKKYNIPNSVTGIREYAFDNCRKLVSITITNNVTSIEDFAFNYCTALTSISIPNSLNSIKYGAFIGCSSLTSITIPNSVTSIGNSVFTSCNSLTSINVDNGNNYYSSKKGVLFNKNETELIKYPAGKENIQYNISDSVTRIREYAFDSCSSLISVIIPDSVTNIEDYAFIKCSKLIIYCRSNTIAHKYAIDKKLSYEIEDLAPTIINIEGNPKEWTNENIKLTVNAEDNLAGLAEKAYSFDGGKTWQVENTKTYNNQENVVIQVKDNLGNIATKEIEIKIDKEKPIIKSIEGNPEGWTNEDVTIKINAEDNLAGLAEEAYSFDGGTTWQKENTKTYNQNTKGIKVQVKDKAGNIEICEEEINITKIDKEKPIIKSVEGNPEEWTNEDVTIKINAEDNQSGLAEEAYSFDGGKTWQKDNTKTYSQNTDGIIVKVRDNLGNIATYEEEIDITKIIKLEQIYIEKEPTKTSYIEGEKFDKTGIKVVAKYNNGESKEITNYTVTNGENLKVGQTSVTISYTEDGITKEVSQLITVVEKLEAELKEEASYEIKQDGENVYLENIKPGTTIETILNSIETNGEIKLYKGTTQITDKSTKITTGITIVISKGTEKIELKIVVIGDLNGDGQMNDIDLLMLARYKAKLYKELRGEYLRASDILRNGVYADDMDLLKMARVLVSLDKI